MGKIFSEAKAQWLLWRLVVARVILFSVMTLGSCWLTATNSIDLTQLSAWEWFQTILGCFVAWCGTMLAFIDSTVTKISTGQIPGTVEEPRKSV